MLIATFPLNANDPPHTVEDPLSLLTGVASPVLKQRMTEPEKRTPFNTKFLLWIFFTVSATGVADDPFLGVGGRGTIRKPLSDFAYSSLGTSVSSMGCSKGGNNSSLSSLAMSVSK